MAAAESISLIRLRLKPTLRLADDGYLFDGATAETYTLNPTGQCLLRALQNGCEATSLWCELVAAFEVSEPRARRDVRNFLTQLRQLRLLVEDARPL
jgi:hypothetical protein